MKKAYFWFPVILSIALLGMLFAGVACADPFLTCQPQQKSLDEHPENDIAGYKVQFDDGTWVDAGMKENDDGTVQLMYDLANVPDGKHVVKAKAYNTWGESDPSDPFVFKRNLPSAPGGLRFSTR